jgi:hypothetical protein
VDTELGRGTTTHTRTFRLLRPEEVADAVVDTIRRGRVDVWLPWHAGLLHRLATASPRPVMELVTRVLRVDRVLEAPDAAARRAYEDRAAR